MNFYTLVKYFWVLAFVAVVFNIAYGLDDYWRLGICLVMILIFSVADGLMNDRKILTKKDEHHYDPRHDESLLESKVIQ